MATQMLPDLKALLLTHLPGGSSVTSGHAGCCRGWFSGGLTKEPAGGNASDNQRQGNDRGQPHGRQCQDQPGQTGTPRQPLFDLLLSDCQGKRFGLSPQRARCAPQARRTSWLLRAAADFGGSSNAARRRAIPSRRCVLVVFSLVDMTPRFA